VQPASEIEPPTFFRAERIRHSAALIQFGRRPPQAAADFRVDLNSVG
jgi:hypothetical protein